MIGTGESKGSGDGSASPVAESRARSSRLNRRSSEGPTASRRRIRFIAISFAVLLVGVALAIVAGATPPYSTNVLPQSGSFFALAESGTTLFAASDNGGSILLERSTDRGSSWSASPVPYSAVAGGAPWSYAVVAADGNNLLLAAATGDLTSAVTPTPVPYPVTALGAAQVVVTPECGTSSTLLLATSHNGGTSWSSSTLRTTGVAVSALDAGVVGGLEAVAWQGQTIGCNGTATEIQTVTSDSGGASWAGVRSVALTNQTLESGTSLRMAPGADGLDLAFLSEGGNGSGPELNVWNDSGSSAAGFAPMLALTAPTTWTLQGQPGVGAFLLTPTYLIPLTSGSITALPFDQLQADDPSLGELPNVVSLVQSGPHTVAVAATTSDDLGVDCWQIDIASDVVSQTCHVEFSPPLGSAQSPLPVVALLDGGDWWTAIGASGEAGCAGGAACPAPSVVGGGSNYSGGPPPAVPSAGASSNSVGTSICQTGCSSSAGLVSYTFTRSNATNQATLTDVAALLAVAGLVGLVVSIWRYRRAATPEPAAVPVQNFPSPRLARAYRSGVLGWAVAWSPLVFLAFLPELADQATVVVAVVVLGWILGLALTAPFLWSVRRNLADRFGFSPDHLWEGVPPPPRGSPAGRVRWTAACAYASWICGVGVLMLLVAEGFATGTSESLAAVGLPLVGLVVVGGILRASYHYGLATLSAASDRELSVLAGTGRAGTRPRLRETLAAALLPWNPFVGLVMGAALVGVGFGNPLLLVWVFLPITLVGIALSSGAFGPLGRPVESVSPGPAQELGA